MAALASTDLFAAVSVPEYCAPWLDIGPRTRRQTNLLTKIENCDKGLCIELCPQRAVLMRSALATSASRDSQEVWFSTDLISHCQARMHIGHASARFRAVTQCDGSNGWRRSARSASLLVLEFYLLAYAVLPYLAFGTASQGPSQWSCPMCMHGNGSRCPCCNGDSPCTCRISADEDESTPAYLDVASLPQAPEYAADPICAQKANQAPKTAKTLQLRVPTPPPRIGHHWIRTD